MTISARPARISDAGDIARLTTELGYEVEASTLAPRLSRLLSRPDQQLLVAECDGRVVGWVHAVVSEYVELDAFAVIGGLVVDRRHRRKGIGRRLMREAEEWARASGCSVVRLWSSTSRTASHEFYRQLGYTKVKTQYSFVKSLDGSEVFTRFVPRVDGRQG
ncbi:MAG TPA: GNAT family N-acetyltransferase [Vicinamibacterales bacterium]|nr:GNAT family N-acetyltransferase [Vicinamibacterales bacterium]